MTAARVAVAQHTADHRCLRPARLTAPACCIDAQFARAPRDAWQDDALAFTTTKSMSALPADITQQKRQQVAFCTVQMRQTVCSA